MSGAEAVKVIVRCRPMNKRERDLKCQSVVSMEQKTLSCSIINPGEPNGPPKTFSFDGVYGPDSTTESIYSDNGFNLVEGVLEGYNGTVFAYGQTGCGKSFSMQGIPDPANQRGIIPRSFEHIFEAIDASENMKYLVHASYLEIYNEEIRDLLGKDIKQKLDLKEHPEKGIYVQDISLHPVQNTQECENLMEKGWKNRATGATLMNADSSRSHSIFTINIEMLDTSENGQQQIRQGKLNLVDLAGSERQSKTGAQGSRLKEATKINLSLSALGNVISALVDGKSKHIPYRDSKLTRLLQDSLGGNTKTMMIACLSPADNNYDETLSTLRYANRAKNITNKPKINEDPKDAMLREYQNEIQKLKQLLEQQPGGGLQGDLGVPNEEILEAERQRVREEYEREMEEMRTKFENEQQSKAKIQAEVEDMKRHYEERLQELNDRSNATMEREVGPNTVVESDDLKEDQSQTDQKSINAYNEEQRLAMEKLRKLQQAMIQGGKRKDDVDLKERRLKMKRAAEKRMKMLGEALGHVDDEDGVLVKVYEDIQTELLEKTAALKKMKARVKALNSEISDIQSEFEKDRQDYLDTIRKQDQQLLLLQAILDKVQPTLRKDCNYSNMEKIKSESVWNDENQRWKVPDLIIQKTKLPPAGVQHVWGNSTSDGAHSQQHHDTEYLENYDDNDHLEEEKEDNALSQKLAKSEEEDVVGNYFKPHRASKLMAQAQETQKAVNLIQARNARSGNTNGLFNNNNNHNGLTATNGNAYPNGTYSNLATSFNSGLNTVGLNNSYASFSTGGGSSAAVGRSWPAYQQPSSLYSTGVIGGTSGNAGGYSSMGYTPSVPSNYVGEIATIRKPTRLEALPSMGKVSTTQSKKKSVPVLNTMGTF